MKLLHLRLKGNFVRMKRSSLIQTVFYRWYVQYNTILGIIGKKYVKSFSRNETANPQVCAVAQNRDQGSPHQGAIVYICKKNFWKISWPYFGEPYKCGSYTPCLVRAFLELGKHYIVHWPVTHVTWSEGVEHFITISLSRTHVLPDSCDFRLCEGGILWGEQS